MLQVRLHGLGGQGVVSAAKMLAEAVGLYEGRYAQAMPAYGHERRGAPVFAYLVISEEPILLKSFVYEPDFVLVFDTAVIRQGVEVAAGARPETCFVVNSRGPLPPEEPWLGFPSIYWVDATAISLKHVGRNIPNAAMMGAFAATGALSLDAVCAAIRHTWQGEAGERNVRACQEAYASVRRGS